MAKKQLKKAKSKVPVTEEAEKQFEVKPSTPEAIDDAPQAPEEGTDAPKDPQADADSEIPQATVTSTDSRKRMSGSARGVCAMHKVVTKKAQGKKFKIRYNRIGVPIGDTRHTLQSYIGMLARTMVPIDIPSWPKVNHELKAKIWRDIQVQLNLFLFPKYRHNDSSICSPVTCYLFPSGYIQSGSGK